MKLSEAIRLGSMLKPKADVLVSGNGTCAIGAALDAVSAIPVTWWMADFDALYIEAETRWPILRGIATSPVNESHHGLVRRLIISLNDRVGWTREQIADWVESIEREQDAKTVPQPIDIPVER